MSVLKKKDFWNLWISQTMQSLAQVLLSVVVMVEIFRGTNSVLGASSVLVSSSIASFLGGIVASFWINKFSLVKLLFGIGITRALLTMLLFPLLLTSSIYSLIVILIILFVSSFVGSWYNPARFALLPLIINKNEYMKASGSISLINQIILTSGWALAGVLSLYVPFKFILIIIILFWILSGIFISFIRIYPQTLTEEKLHSSPKSNRSWSNLIKIPVVKSITLMDLSETLANSIWSSALLLAFTKIILGKSEDWWGLLNAGYFIGAILGSVIVIGGTNYFNNRMGKMIGISSLQMGILTFIFAITPIPIVAFLLCIIMGPLYQIRDICQETMLQDVIPSNELASTLAARSAILYPWVGIAYAVMGYLSDILGIRYVYILAAMLYSVTCLLVFIQPNIRNYQYAEKTQSVDNPHSNNVT